MMIRVEGTSVIGLRIHKLARQDLSDDIERGLTGALMI